MTLSRPSDVLNGSPWWVRAMAYFGVPSIIALFLIHLLANIMLGAIQTHDQTTVRQGEAMIRLLRELCAQGAGTQEERRRCFSD